MPVPDSNIPPPLLAALFECYEEAARLVPAELRPQFILIGAAASIAHSSRLRTEDVDVAASHEAQVRFMNAVHSGATRFKINPTDANQTIEFNSRQDFIVTIENLQLGGPFVESINAVEPFLGGFVASLADLLCCRAVTVANRRDDGDLADFYSLFELMVEKGLYIELSAEKLELLGRLKRQLSCCERVLLSALLTREVGLWFLL